MAGGVSQAFRSRYRWIIGIQAAWLITLLFLVAWWGYIIFKQNDQIAELESRLGVASQKAIDREAKLNRMIFWESGTFFILLIISSSVLSVIYLKDVRRTQSLQAFFASLTHELRTPLTGIRLQAEWIKDSIKDGDPIGAKVDRLMSDSHRLEAQVDRSLELARIEGGGSLHLKTLSISTWLKDYALRSQRIFKDQVTLELDTHDDQIIADPTSLETVLNNLIENSIRHAGADSCQVRFSNRSEVPGEMILAITDNGNTQEYPPALGELFSRGEQSSGSGVGLYLVRSLMEKMGGHARFITDPKFRVELVFRTDHGKT